jgi:hypothetical protein
MGWGFKSQLFNIFSLALVFPLCTSYISPNYGGENTLGKGFMGWGFKVYY